LTERERTEMTFRTLRALLTSAFLIALGCADLPYGVDPRTEPPLDELTVKIGHTPRRLLDESRVTPRRVGSRQQRLVELFEWAGCREVEEGERRGWRSSWVSCRLAGETGGAIVVSAPFGRRGSRIRRDAWMGAALLPSLYRSIRAVERHYTYVFIAYEEPPPDTGNLPAIPIPSDALSDHVNDQLVASIGIERIRFESAGVWRAGGNPPLYRDFVSVSKSLEIPAVRIRSKRKTPRARDIPSISIRISDRDLGEYLDSFRLVAAYLGYLDQTIPIRDELHASKPVAAGPRRPAPVSAD
jgi:hypothetical protein